MKRKARWIILAATLPITFALFAFWGSVSNLSLEPFVIEKSDHQISTIERHSFGNAGLVIVAEDSSGKGEVFVFVRLIPTDRYQLTKMMPHDKAQGESFAGLDIYNAYSLSLEDQLLHIKGETISLGYLWVLLLKLLAGLALSAAIAAAIRLKAPRTPMAKK